MPDDDLADQADRYQAMRWRVPLVDWPVDVLKIHAAQLGIALGIPLGVLSVASFEIMVDTAGVTIALDGLAVSAGVALGIAKLVMDFVRETEESTIALVQVREKPHYFLWPMLAAWLGIVLVG